MQVSQEIVEAVLKDEAFHVMLASALALEFTFMRAEPESWLKAAKGVCDKILEPESYSEDDPTPGASGT